MASELGMYLAELLADVEFISKSAEDDATSQRQGNVEYALAHTHVATLLAMLRKFCIRYPPRKHEFCTCGACVHYIQLDRIARAAREKSGG